jgi:hypothetical protein
MAGASRKFRSTGSVRGHQFVGLLWCDTCREALQV